MTTNGATSLDRPTSDQIGAALARIAASEALRASPQLVSFLRYVVTTTLAGHSDRIKGYTIATEALGRETDFDPQNDPIVRVEAGRLRRALNRYYADEGADDAIVINLPRGGYVPAFEMHVHRDDPPPPPAGPPASPLPSPPRMRPARRPFLAAMVAVVMIAAAGTAVLGFRPAAIVPAASPAATTPPPLRVTGSPMPIVTVRTFDELGPRLDAATLDSLRNKLREALARFDEIEMADDSGAQPALSPPARRRVYRLTATAEPGTDGVLRLYFRLADAADGVVLWARSFGMDPQTPASSEEIVRQVAGTIASPYGVVYARELMRRGGADTDPRYACLLDAMEFRRSHDAAMVKPLRACLTGVTAGDPSFASGFIALALLNLHDYRIAEGGRAALDASLRAARRAVELAPESARAHQMMMSVLYARGLVAPALAEGERAIGLNPYDMIVLASYGTRLISSGNVEKGKAVLEQVTDIASVAPPSLSFALFLAAYLSQDETGAAYYASLITKDGYAFGLLARALVAAKAGDRAECARLMAQLSRSSPLWNTNPRAAIQRYIADVAIVDRLAGDLASAGITSAR